MLYSYNQCKTIYGSNYNLKKAIEERKIYKIEKGIYSDDKFVSELSIISMKYPKAIFTLNSAFYYHGLSDVIPNYYFLSTTKETSRIRDIRIRQIYENNSEINLGLISMNYNNISIRVYNKERMLIELIRNKSKMPFDYYKEIILNYRRIIDSLDMHLIQEYANALPKTNMVMEVLQLEVL